MRVVESPAARWRVVDVPAARWPLCLPAPSERRPLSYLQRGGGRPPPETEGGPYAVVERE